MALTSVILANHPELINQANGWNGLAPTVYNLANSHAQLNGPMMAMIEQNHLAQFSSEMIHYYLKWQAHNALGLHTEPAIHEQIRGLLAAGDHPIISLPGGPKHAVVAYDLEPGNQGNGDYYIDVYDCNREYTSAENTNAVAHVKAEKDSRIHVVPGQGWS